jgi:site-specific DNA recombinase
MTTSGPRRAAIYLRVSSAQQANVDYDPEGFSIPAQREACARKAASLEAEVVAEYIDRGESAKTADRPDLKAMLDRLALRKDIDLVIVHKVDRLARNRADDVTIAMQIRSAGAQLVSATENIDETPSGLLLHGIMSSIAEFYSRNLASEVIKGTTEKAKRGGTPGIAALGYLNVPRDGRRPRSADGGARP